MAWCQHLPWVNDDENGEYGLPEFVDGMELAVV